MKLFSYEYVTWFKIVLMLTPLIAATIAYFYVAHPFLHGPGFVEHIFARARRYQIEGDDLKAIKEYDTLIKHDPKCAAAYFNQAQLYAARLEWEKACEGYEKALTEDITNDFKHLIHFCYGTALFRLEQLHEAKKHLNAAIAIKPDAKVIMQRSLVLMNLGELDASLKDLKQAVAVISEYGRGFLDLGNKFRDNEQFEKAIECYTAATQHMPEFYGGYLLLGDVLHLHAKKTENSDLFTRAIACYKKTLELNPECYQAEVNLALMNMEQERYEDAGALLESALLHNPDFSNTHLALGIHYTRNQDLLRGFSEYEWRFKLPDHIPNRYESSPRWDGTTSLQGKTILLHSEQGYGDTFNFLRYARYAKEELGATVIVEVQDRLKTLISLCPYIDKVIISSDPIPAFDYQAPLLSMTSLVKTTINTIPNKMPYLYADNTLVRDWQKHLQDDTNFKIGLIWQVEESHDTIKYSNQDVSFKIPQPKRSISLEHLKPILELEGVSCYSLQFSQQNDHPRLITFGPDFDTKNGPFMDTAAIIKNLDLIITVDTSIAHLAAGLGAQTWIILPFAPEWRWFLNRADSPWYPTVKLFRTRKKKDWNATIQNIGDALRPLIAKHKGAFHEKKHSIHTVSR